MLLTFGPYNKLLLKAITHTYPEMFFEQPTSRNYFKTPSKLESTIGEEASNISLPVKEN